MRVFGARTDGPLAAQDLQLEVCERDGTWIPLRGITQFRVEVLPNELVRAHEVNIELWMLQVAVPLSQLRTFGVQPFEARDWYVVLRMLAQDVAAWWRSIEWP